MSNTCIRVLADPVQIKDCKETLKRLDGKLTDITKVFNLSGNGARFKILFLLHQEGKMCPCDLSDILSISVGGVSQHLSPCVAQLLEVIPLQTSSLKSSPNV